MASVGWGQGSPEEPDTKIAQALISYAMRGGALFSARRWAENPLTLTHALWQSPDGDTLEAYRPPDDDLNLFPEEREAWVQVAVHTMAEAASGPAGRAASWLPVRMEPTQALDLGQRIQQARAEQQRQARFQQQQRAMQSSGSYAPQMGSPMGPPMRPPMTPPYFAQGSSRPMQAPQFPQAPMPPRPPAPGMSPLAPGATPPHAPHPLPQQGPSNPFLGPTAGSPWREARSSASSQDAWVASSPSQGEFASLAHEQSGWSDGWRAGAGPSGRSGLVMDSQEVTTLVCIEVEMPLTPGNGLAEDYVRDFARDVTLHFSRAARALPQTRDLRGWMRGGRIVLAARLAVGTGARPPSRAEMETAARLLADALAQRTLPYTRLTFPDPQEWAQGVRLPD